MTGLSTAYRMAAYMAWADDVMLSNAEQLSEQALRAPRDTLFKSISGTFDHTLVVAEIFKSHLEGRSHSFSARRREQLLAFSEVARRLRAINDYYVSLAKRWSDQDLAEIITFEFVGGGAGAMTREDILLHLVNHSTYHRGFVSTLLFTDRISFKPNDLTVFLRDVWPKMSRNSLEETA